MFVAEVVAEKPARPTLFYTVDNGAVQNPRSVAVLNRLYAVLGSEPEFQDIAIKVFDSERAVREAFGNGHSPEAAVVFVDGQIAKTFTPSYRGRKGAVVSPWAAGTYWIMLIGEQVRKGGEFNHGRVDNVVYQLRAWFGRKFDTQMMTQQLPWGSTRKGERSPCRIILPEEALKIVERLNKGPNLVDAIADKRMVEQLPRGTRISWIRVPGSVARYSRATMDAHLQAVAAFERACATLTHNPEVASAIMAGVELDSSVPELRDCYLKPTFGAKPITEWSVRRPDMHVNGDKLVASENDEMPGGFTDLVHVDRAYHHNSEAWQRCFDWLFSEGPLVFVVSDGWSAGYIESARWLVETLRVEGRDAQLVTTPDLDRFTIGDTGVLLDGIRVGTIWRQFPVFETTGMLAKLVLASQAGKVRMVPEFAHFGNKSWFSQFWSNQAAFTTLLQPNDLAILRELIPESHLMLPGRWSENFAIAGKEIQGIAGLYGLMEESRAKFVLKITGANTLAARSYGVFVDGARDRVGWQEWIDTRARLKRPFIVQARFDTSVERIAVWNLKTSGPEIFPCRILLRPWMVGGKLVSSHNCCSPSYTTKVHGMLDMAIQPIELV